MISEITLNSTQLKDVLKSAIIELLQENREKVVDILTEIIEDIAMEKAIKKRKNTEYISRDSILKRTEQ